MVTKAPAVAPAPNLNWTGCYIGGHVGWGWGRKDISEGEIAPASPGLNTVFRGFRDDIDGFLGGAQSGCNYQLNPNWVIGVEAQFSWSDIKGDFSTDPFLFGKSAGRGTFSAKTDWVTTVAGRVGYAWDRWMLYGTAGIAWVRDKYSLVRTEPPDPFFVSASETRSGWMLGAGLEYALSNNWSAKLEYNYLDFGSKRIALAGTFRVDQVTSEVGIDQQLHVLRFGVNYRFDWARY
jgi:outer membrane immunogenic protein